MRESTIWTGVSATYRLEVRLDDQTVAEHLVEAGGLRRDRPLYVFLETPLSAGDVNLGIGFVRVEKSHGDSHDEDRESRDALRESLPRHSARTNACTLRPAGCG